MDEKNNILTLQDSLNERLNNEPLRVLSEREWEFWRVNGYVIIKNAVPKEHIERLRNLIWEFEEKDPEDSSTWYAPPRAEIKMSELKNTGMVELYNHQFLWDNRMYEKVYNAFVDIWGTEKLWSSIDRCNLNMPIKPGHEYKGFIHWDVNTSLDPVPVNVQGVLSLVDTTEDMGGFQCIPELYRDFPEWVKTQPLDRNPYKPDITGYTTTKIAAKAGDLLIFNSMQPHGIRANHSDKPRIAQYISMFPAQEENEDLRQTRIRSWEERVPPAGDAFPGDPRNWEQTKYDRAELTELGKKLLGLNKW
ncbi:phytanoyl-CoA dioxygenase family protein [Metabacillus idriensis]|uniref:Phytanoyl-CoA dioxygenase n=1 Tax=Metabacillus idriensis TaxID=324768 RepID=A0A6I2MGH9_9BACI|nr:phytanoyl-CoA dioxygenase family protein [Metabacillus idriensis]MCM3596177.1 phytanoyl-CoA dioxygenase family protein [Metabacillus idriensis]MRX56474.1 phytanoyl-CoA dioxygenase [Metabacillus idriensis]OHR66113.1 phytanoyl-CoA dioxygenase [Bacillus sp. HMSC76G11]